MAERYAGRVDFVVVYIREAHPEDGWVVTPNRNEDIRYLDPTTDEERHDVAAACALRLQIRVPVDDTHTWHLWYSCYRFDDGVDVPEQEAIPVYDVPWRDERGEFITDFVDGGDIKAWVTQGSIADRTRENLGSSDKGIALYRRLLLDVGAGGPVDVDQLSTEAPCRDCRCEQEQGERDVKQPSDRTRASSQQAETDRHEGECSYEEHALPRFFVLLDEVLRYDPLRLLMFILARLDRQPCRSGQQHLQKDHG